MTEDAELLRRYAEDKSEAAFAELVRRHLDLVYSTALRQLAGDTHLAQDVAQTVFTDLARKASSLTGHAALTGWLYLGAHHAAAQAVRGEQRRRARELEASTMHELFSSSDAATDWDRVRPVLDDAMRELTEPDREAVLLRYFEKRPFADIGAAFHLSDDAARMRVDRALEKLRTLLGRRGVTTTALAVVLVDQAVAAAPAGLTTVVCNTAFAQATAGAGGGAASWLAFMSTTKFTAIVAVALVILAISTARHEATANGEAAASLDADSRGNAVLFARLSDLEQRVQVAEENRNQLQRMVDDATQAAKGVAATVPPSDPAANGRDFLAQHPEAARLVTDYQRAQVGKSYQVLFKTLKLSPQQIEQFLAIMVQAGAGVRWNTAAQAPFAEFGIGEKISTEERESRVRAVLGDADYARYREFQRTGAARDFVEQVSRNVNFSNAPLTAMQAEQLMTIIARHSSDYQAGQNVGLGNFDWDAASQEAQGVLGEKQFAAFRGVRDQIQFSRVLNRAVGEAMKTAKQAAGIPANF